MGLDIRLPIGLMFTLIGLLLAVSGYLTRGNTVMYARSLGININLVWGIVLLVFGTGMLLAARRACKTEEQAVKPKNTSTAGKP